MDNGCRLLLLSRFFIVIGLGLLWTSLEAQNSFEIILSSDNDEIIYKGEQLESGSYIFTGSRAYAGYMYPYLIKVSSSGSVQELEIVRQDTLGYFETFEVLDSGEILLIGHCNFSDTIQRHDHLWLCKMDTNLTIIEEKFYGMLKDDYYAFNSYCSSLDSVGNIEISGNLHYYPGHRDMIFIKVNQLGDTLLSKSYHYQFDQVIGPIINSPGGQLLSHTERILTTHPLSIVELDSNLNITEISATSYDYITISGLTVTWLNDSIYLRSATSYDHDNENFQIGVTLHDQDHQILEELIFDKVDTIDWPAWNYSHSYLNDSTIYVSGFENHLGSYNSTPATIYLYLIDSELNVLGQLDFGGEFNYDIVGVEATNDEGCIVYGRIYDNYSMFNEYDVYIRKFIREELELITELKEVGDQNYNPKVWPNPVDQFLNVSVLNAPNDHKVVSIFDFSGRLVYRRDISEKCDFLRLNTYTLKAGTYIINIKSQDGIISSSKFIKL